MNSKMNIRKNSLNLFLLFALIISSSTLLYSQGMRMSSEERVKRIKEQLSLSDEQTKQVKKIFDQSQEEMMEEMMVNQGDREAMRSAITKITEKTDKEIEKILNDKQKKKYEEVKKERQAMMRQRGQRPPNQ